MVDRYEVLIVRHQYFQFLRSSDLVTGQITNYRTGDQCILMFKPWGRRERDAYEIAGRVHIEASGRVTYDIAGRATSPSHKLW